jgi:diacylglycerol kinase (ATP)
VSSYSDIAIIFNPNSTGNAPGNAKQLKADLRATLPKEPVKLLHTKYAGHAAMLAYDFAVSHESPLIISASGDGGYNEVINGALTAQAEGAKPITAVLPSGNANDHARTMHDKPLLELILEKRITQIDVLKLTTRHAREDTIERYAHSYIGIGLTPKVALELNRTKLNTLVEVWVVTKSFWNMQPVRIRRDNKTEVVDSLICSIIPEMAKVLTLSHTARPEDGLFKVTTIKHRSKLWLLLHLVKGAVIQFGAGQRTDKMTFTLLHPSPVQLDGEIIQLPKNTEIAVSVEPRLLQTLVGAEPIK